MYQLEKEMLQPEEEEIVKRARNFAIKAHKGILRPNRKREPYHEHLKETSLLVKASGGTGVERAAGWLHDVLEDTKVTAEQVRYLFGSDVLAIVLGVTDPVWPEGITTLERKKIQAEHVKNASKSVRLVKLADQTSNVRSVANDPPVKWTNQQCRDYVEGAKLIALECQGICETLDKYFIQSYEKAKASKWLML